MNLKAEQTILQHQLLEQQDRVVVGFSGGADSVTLLHFLCRSLSHYNLCVTACHINHNLRGAESARDEAFARSFCRRLGIPCHVYSIDAAALAAAQKMSVEEAARNARYAIFAQLADELDAKIATAHTLSDSMETVLLNMTRGTGLKGLRGIPPKRGRIIRPLIDCTRQEIESYCRQNRLVYVTDSSNLSDEYTRNRLRHSVLPVLEEINPAFSRAVSRMTEHLRQDEDFLSAMAKEAAQKARIANGLSATALLQTHPALLGRILLDFLAEHGAPQSEQAANGLRRLLLAGTGSLQTDGRHIFTVKNGVLLCQSPHQTADGFDFSFQSGKIALPYGKQAEIILIDCKNENFSKKDGATPLKSLVDYDKIKNTAVIRSRQAGDRFELPRRGISKPLKKLLNEDKIPPRKRERLVFLADGSEILWAEGYGASPKFAANENTQTAVRIIITEMENDEQ